MFKKLLAVTSCMVMLSLGLTTQVGADQPIRFQDSVTFTDMNPCTGLLHETRMRGSMLTEDIDSSMRTVERGLKIRSNRDIVSRELTSLGAFLYRLEHFAFLGQSLSRDVQTTLDRTQWCVKIVGHFN